MLFDAPFVSLPANKRGRDFCIGDLHGCREMLQRLLDACAFNYRRDRLFSVGDLVHRGPSSVRCLRLAEEPWFYSVMGNHEAMQLGAYYGEIHSSGRAVASMCEYDGPGDPLFPGKPDQADMEAILKGLPLALEFPLHDGRMIGIVHAGLPYPWTWDDVRTMGEATSSLYEKYGGGVQVDLLWDRHPLLAAVASAWHSSEMERHALWATATRYDYWRATQPVAGLDLLVSGHTTLKGKPLTTGTRLYLDTGAGTAVGRLTLVQLGTERYWEVPDPRHHPEMPVTELEGFASSNPEVPWLSSEEMVSMERAHNRPTLPNARLLGFGPHDDF